MVSYNIHELLEMCFADGFTIESISKATDTPVELINRCYSYGRLAPDDCLTLNCLLVFLIELYGVDTERDTYLKAITDTLITYFGVKFLTISKYLDLNECDLEIFLDHPNTFDNCYSISKKLTHLFTTFVRDKRDWELKH